jgi:hypothetical protein
MTPYESVNLPLTSVNWAEHVSLIGQANAAFPKLIEITEG